MNPFSSPNYAQAMAKGLSDKPTETDMKVYAVVLDYGDEGCSAPEAIFSTPEKAKQFVDALEDELQPIAYIFPYEVE